MLKSFSYAFAGVKQALKSEHNLRFHFVAGVITFILGVFLHFNYVEYAILSLTISMVIILELLNTVIEKAMDVVSPEKSEKVKVIKDMSSAAVLFSAINAVVIGLFLFLPKILAFIK